jgi:hypothetical protein
VSDSARLPGATAGNLNATDAVGEQQIRARFAVGADYNVDRFRVEFSTPFQQALCSRRQRDNLAIVRSIVSKTRGNCTVAPDISGVSES